MLLIGKIVVTLFDVARLAGVSTATVSRVVHGQDRVREATRIRVQQAIEELGYVPTAPRRACPAAARKSSAWSASSARRSSTTSRT